MNEVISLNSPSDEEKLRTFLSNELFEANVGDISTTYKSNNVNVIFYKSGKVLIQGKDSSKWYKEIIELLSYSDEGKDENVEIDTRISNTYQRIGSDESGKGDFFGPLVTVAFYLETEKQMKDLGSLGVKDSKKLSDNRVTALASEIQKIGFCEKIMISPSKYNDLYNRIGNLNSILAWSHAKAIENIIQRKPARMIIIDKFADDRFISDAVKKTNAELVLMTNAEREISVAAASILARDTYLKWISNYKYKTGIDLPKGASNEVINTAVKIAEKNGIDSLIDIAKIHFSTYNTVKTKISEL